MEHTLKELESLVFGKKLGDGMSRDVYEYLPDKSCVIKEEIRTSTFQNIVEYKIWEEVGWGDFGKWFAPVEDISPCGRYLIMKKTEPIPKRDLPKLLPHFLTDFKHENFGYITEKGKKRIVCHDYGINLMTKKFTNRMRKAYWD